MKNLLTLVILLFPTLYGWLMKKTPWRKPRMLISPDTLSWKKPVNISPSWPYCWREPTSVRPRTKPGIFFLKNLPEGKYTLRVQGVGYKSAEKEIVIVRGKTQEVNFEISEDAVMLDGAVVTANRNETDRREAPVIVNVLSPKVFENTNSVCLSQA